MMIRVVMFSAIFFAAASVPAAAETGNDGGRLGIGQGANSCWAWTRSHEAKAATQGLYTQWVAGFVSGLNWDTDDPDCEAADTECGWPVGRENSGEWQPGPPRRANGACQPIHE